MAGKSSMKWIKFALALALIMCGSLACLVIGSLNVKQAKDREAEVGAWRTSDATVRYVACDPATKGPCVCVLDVVIDGVSQQAVLVHFDHAANYAVNQVVTVAYNPANPGYVCLPSQVPKPMSTMFVTTAWVMIAMGIVLVISDIGIGIYGYQLLKAKARAIKDAAAAAEEQVRAQAQKFAQGGLID